MSIPLNRLQAFVDQVREVRTLQEQYRRTIDPVVRRRMERAEAELDASAGWLAADLAAEPPESVGDSAAKLAETSSTSLTLGQYPTLEGGAS